MAEVHVQHAAAPGERCCFATTLHRQSKARALAMLRRIAGMSGARGSARPMKHRDQTGWFGAVLLGMGGTERSYTPEPHETLVAFAERVLKAEG